MKMKAIADRLLYRRLYGTDLLFNKQVNNDWYNVQGAGHKKPGRVKVMALQTSDPTGIGIYLEQWLQYFSLT